MPPDNDEVVDQLDPETPQEPDKGQQGDDKEKPAPREAPVSRKEFERLTRQLAETRESERYWAERAKGDKKEAAGEPEDEDSIDTSDLLPKGGTGSDGVDEAILADPEKWVEAISKGPKAIESLIKKQGYVTGKEAAEIAAKVARRTVRVERQKITTDAEISRDYPELQNSESELFKRTAEILRSHARQDPKAARTPLALAMAARAAKAELKAEASAKPKRDDDEYDRYEPERLGRVRAQDTSSGKGSRPVEDDDEYLSPEAREVMRQMDLSAAEYRRGRKITHGGK